MEFSVQSGSAAAGLGIIGSALTVLFPDARWIGWPLLIFGGLIFFFDIKIVSGALSADSRASRLSETGPWLLIIAAPILGFIWLFVQSQSAPSDGQASLARLAELGWSVKATNESILFGANGMLPQMEDSAKQFALLKKPFSIQLQQVAGLNGLKYLSKIDRITKIEINAGEFTDLSELSGFVHLRELTIGQLPLNGTGTVDLSPLSSLINLDRLVLNSVRTKNIAPLSEMKGLKILNLGQTLISDIAPLSGMPLLESLEIRGTRVTDLSPLKASINLRDLMIGEMQVGNLGVLASLERLKSVSIIENGNLDLTSLGALEKIESLMIWCGANTIDVRPLGTLSQLKSLSISGLGFSSLTSISGVDSLSKLEKLETLTVGSLSIGDLGFVSKLLLLKEMTLNQLPIKSLEPIRFLRALAKLTLVDIPIVDISALLSLEHLNELRLIRVPARSDFLSELERRGVKVN